MAFLADIWRRLRDPRTLAEFMRFCATGLTNSVVDFGLYIFLTRTFAFWARHIVAASAIAYAVAICVSFMLNNFWTFRRDGRGWFRRSIKFLIVSYTALGIHVIIFWALTEFGMNDILAKVAATGVGGVWNFLMYKFWAFAVREPGKQSVA